MTYTETDLTTRVAGLLDAAGLNGQLTTDHTALLDQLLEQFHAGGVAAVDKVIDSLEVLSSDTVIDVGSGFGGPARRIAEKTGATVLGIDITRAYVDVAEMLTRRAGLDDLVTFRHADVMNLRADRPFAGATTMHVQMNIADKAAWFAAVADAMAPVARLAVWEVCTSIPDHEPTWPMPWSLDGSDSFLVTADDLLTAVTSAGLDTVDWLDETPWVMNWANTLNTSPPPPGGPVLPMLLDDGFARVVNLSTALAEGTLRVVRGLFTKPVGDGAETT